MLAATTVGAADATWYDAGTGIWNLTDKNWNAGTSAWTAGDTAVFSGAGGTLAFKQAYPGGTLEVSAAVQGGNAAEPLMTASALAFTGENKVRVTEAETLDMETFGQIKTVARLNTALKFGPMRGTQILVK